MANPYFLIILPSSAKNFSMLVCPKIVPYLIYSHWNSRGMLRE